MDKNKTGERTSSIGAKTQILQLRSQEQRAHHQSKIASLPQKRVVIFTVRMFPLVLKERILPNLVI